MENRTEGSLAGLVDIISILKDILREWWVILILSVSVSLFANIWVNQSYKPQYTVTSTFVVTAKGMNTNVYQNLTSAKELAGRFAQVLNSNVMKRKVAGELGMKKFTASTSVNILPETNLMELTVTADSAMESYNVMKSIMNNYNSVSDYVIENVILEVIQPPMIPMAPSNSLNVKDVMKKSFLISAAVLIAFFAVLSYFKDTVKNEKEVLKKVDARYLGTIYHERKVKSLRGIRKAGKLSMLIQNPLLSFRFVESNKMTASRVRNHMKKHGYKTLLVTSVMENEGKSTVAANLALALAQENNHVLLIDCDFRKPAQYKIFGTAEEDTVNLPDILENKKASASILKKQKHSGLYTIFNSTPMTSPEGLLENGVLERILDFFRKKMDYIIVDTSPMALVSDTEELAQFMDAAVLVIKQDMVLAKDINDMIDVLNRTQSKVLGCIFNDVVTRLTESGSRYGSHYGYGGHYGKNSE